VLRAHVPSTRPLSLRCPPVLGGRKAASNNEESFFARRCTRLQTGHNPLSRDARKSRVERSRLPLWRLVRRASRWQRRGYSAAWCAGSGARAGSGSPGYSSRSPACGWRRRDGRVGIDVWGIWARRRARWNTRLTLSRVRGRLVGPGKSSVCGRRSRQYWWSTAHKWDESMT